MWSGLYWIQTVLTAERAMHPILFSCLCQAPNTASTQLIKFWLYPISSQCITWGIKLYFDRVLLLIAKLNFASKKPWLIDPPFHDCIEDCSLASGITSIINSAFQVIPLCSLDYISNQHLADSSTVAVPRSLLSRAYRLTLHRLITYFTTRYVLLILLRMANTVHHNNY